MAVVTTVPIGHHQVHAIQFCPKSSFWNIRGMIISIPATSDAITPVAKSTRFSPLPA